MKANTYVRAMTLVLMMTFWVQVGAGQDFKNPAASPWGRQDEIGALNKMTDQTRLAVLGRISSGKVYDLGVEYFKGMPGIFGLNDPRYQYWLTHSNHGFTVDDPFGVGPEGNQKILVTGDAVSMYTHTGTHIDALNHFGLNGRIYNGFSAEEYQGDGGWRKEGAETIPPVVARGVMIDVAEAKGLKVLPPAYRVTADDLEAALGQQGTQLESGDVVLIRTGRMSVFEDTQRFVDDFPGLTLEAVRWLVDENGAMMLGADNLGFEVRANEEERKESLAPVHTFLLAQRGVMFMEVVNLEGLARDKVYEFVFLGASIKYRGASGAPMRPMAIPIR